MIRDIGLSEQILWHLPSTLWQGFSRSEEASQGSCTGSFIFGICGFICHESVYANRNCSQPVGKNVMHWNSIQQFLFWSWAGNLEALYVSNKNISWFLSLERSVVAILVAHFPCKLFSLLFYMIIPESTWECSFDLNFLSSELVNLC